MSERESAEVRNVVVSDILPHRPPFVFVDSAQLIGRDSLVASKKIREEDFDFYKHDNSGRPYSYPREMLIEHAAQSMMLLGHHYGRDIGWLPEGYSSIGLLTTIEDFSFNSIPIRPGDEVVTRVDVGFEKRALYYIGVKARIQVRESVAAEGTICGMFLTGQYDRLFENLGEYRVSLEGGVSRPNFSFVDRLNPLYFDSTYWFLKGHFPGSPCIPGCMFLRGVNELADSKKKIRRVVRAKFKKIAVPHRRYRYEIGRDDNKVSFSVVEAESGEVHAKGIVELEP